MKSREAAAQFYQLLQGKNPQARARWREILGLAQQGDPQAIRAMYLVHSAMQSVRVGASPYDRPKPSPQRIEQLRQMLIAARYA